MAQFQVGDKVRRTGGSVPFEDMIQGNVYTVAKVSRGSLYVEGNDYGYEPAYFTLVTTSPIDEEIEKVQADKAAAKNRLFDLRLLRSLANDNGYTLTKESA